MSNPLKAALPLGLTGIVSVAFTIVVMRTMFAPATLVSIDLSGLLHRYSQHLAQQGLSIEDQTAKARHYAERVDKAVAFYATRTHSVIVVEPAVMAGCQDITDDIVTLLTAQQKDVPPRGTT